MHCECRVNSANRENVVANIKGHYIITIAKEEGEKSRSQNASSFLPIPTVSTGIGHSLAPKARDRLPTSDHKCTTSKVDKDKPMQVSAAAEP